MGLDGLWQIQIVFKRTSKTRAYAEWTAGYHTGTLTFDATTYETADEKEIDHLICHELYHFVHAREDDALAGLIGRGTEVYRKYTEEGERCADQFARMMIRAYARKRSDG